MTESERPNKSEASERDRRYIAFSLGNEQYAIPLLKAKEFIGATEPTPVPQTPEYFKGIINLRGQVISVIDLRSKLRLPKSGMGSQKGSETSIIILSLGAIHLGMIVDSINCVLALGDDELGPPPNFESSSQPNYVIGVARKENRLTLILDIDSLLGGQDFGSLSGATANLIEAA